MTSLFRNIHFYLTRSLSHKEKSELQQLIQENGGVVFNTPSNALQVVRSDMFDPMTHSNWISREVINESIASQSVEHLVQSTETNDAIRAGNKANKRRKRQRRRQYTVEDDANMLQFAISRGWKAMQTMAKSMWQLAENEKVTLHSAQSMHEHFRKQLQRKTLIEQRDIIAKAAATKTKVRVLNEEVPAGHEEKKVQDTESHSNSTGLQTVTTSEPMTILQTSRQLSTPPAVDQHSRTMAYKASPVATCQVEKISRRDVKTRSRKPTSPLKITQRLERSEGTELIGDMTTSIVAASSHRPFSSSPLCSVTSETLVAQAAKTASSETGGQRADRKRLRESLSSEATSSQDSSHSHENTAGSDTNSVKSIGHRGNGVFFRSAWTELTRDHAKRQMLQRFFSAASSAPPASEVQASGIEPVVTDPINAVVLAAAPHVEEGLQKVKTLEHATNEDTDRIICQLQLNTHQDMPTVVHAAYYCSGDAEMAEAFLKGALPLNMWSPEDDLLLMNLVAQENIDRCTVDAAVARGDFASMRVSRDTDAILKRVQFLR